MTADRTTIQGKDLGQPATPDSPQRRRPSPTRTPVEKILPPEILERIQEILRTVSTVDAKLVHDLDERFNIDDRFGITKRRLKSYLKRTHNKAPIETRTETQDEGKAGRSEYEDSDPLRPESTPNEDDRLRAHRLRQASIASILDATFGPLADCKPELWDRRAYLMIVGLVYDRLACTEEELPAKELVALAKGLAEARRAEVRARECESEAEPQNSPPPPTGPLPENFADIVRQVYGTNFHDPSESGSGHPHDR